MSDDTNTVNDEVTYTKVTRAFPVCHPQSGVPRDMYPGDRLALDAAPSATVYRVVEFIPQGDFPWLTEHGESLAFRAKPIGGYAFGKTLPEAMEESLSTVTGRFFASKH